MPRNLPSRDQHGNFVSMADTGAAPDPDALAAVLSQLLGAPVSADLLTNPRALSTIKEILCPPGSGNAQPGPRDADGQKLSDDRRADLLSKSPLGQAAAAKLSEDDPNTDATSSTAPQPQQMGELIDGWLAGGRYRGAERQAHRQFSERPSVRITRADAQRAAQQIIQRTPTADGKPVQAARLDHLRKLSGIKPTK